jgi:hypothetical protein
MYDMEDSVEENVGAYVGADAGENRIHGVPLRGSPGAGVVTARQCQMAGASRHARVHGRVGTRSIGSYLVVHST